MAFTEEEEAILQALWPSTPPMDNKRRQKTWAEYLEEVFGAEFQPVQVALAYLKPQRVTHLQEHKQRVDDEIAQLSKAAQPLP